MVIALSVLVSIVSRLAGIYLPGTAAIAGYGMGAAGALGLAQTAMTRGHVQVDLVISRLRHGLQDWMEIVATLITLVVIGFASWNICRMVMTSWRIGDLSSNADGLPLWLPQLPMALGFVVFAIALMHLAVLGLLRRWVRKPAATDVGL